jgi:hypothetical protein
MSRTHSALFAGLGLELAAFTGLAWLGDASVHLNVTLALFALAGVGFLIAVFATRRRPVRLLSILLASLLLRVPLLAVQPTLSDDVWRYLHDGRAQLAGVSPYAFPPADSATGAFRGPEYVRINHPDLVTIYPPFTQLAFLLTAALGGTLAIWKVLLLAAEATVIALLAALLRRNGREPTGAILYAWHPLVVLEVAGSAHLEPIAIAPLLAAFLLALSSRSFAAGALLGLSVAAKYFALPLVPFLDRERTPRVLLGMISALLLVSLPYLFTGANLLGSLPLFGRSWVSNAGLFSLLDNVFGAYGARAVAATLLLGLLVNLWQRRAAREDAAFTFVFATLLLSPVVHPWYLIWLVALVPIARVRPAITAAAIAWSLTVPSAYLAIPTYRRTGEWSVPQTALLLQYLPVLLLLVTAIILQRTDGHRSAMPAEAPSG